MAARGLYILDCFGSIVQWSGMNFRQQTQSSDGLGICRKGLLARSHSAIKITGLNFDSNKTRKCDGVSRLVCEARFYEGRRAVIRRRWIDLQNLQTPFSLGA